MVIERRKIDLGDIEYISSGRIFVGNEAIKYKLADYIGDEEDARDFLIENKYISKNIKVRYVHLKPSNEKYGDHFIYLFDNFNNMLKNFFHISNKHQILASID